MQHIIKKQIIDLTIDRKTDAFTLQHEVSRHYWSKVVHELEQVFDSISSPGEVIQLDKLEIDLGVISLKDIEKGRWSEMVSTKIAEQIVLARHQAKEGIKTQSKPLSISQQWIYYMLHGYLPWNTLLVDENWYEYVLEGFAANAVAIDQLRSVISKNLNAVKRIIFQHNEKFLATLVETLTAEKQDTLSQTIDEIAEIITSLNQQIGEKFLLQKKELKQKLWQQVLQLAALQEQNLNPQKIALNLLAMNIEEGKAIEKLQPDLLSKLKVTAATLEQVRSENKKGLIEDKTDAADLSSVDKPQTPEETFVPFAGIVLLHSFFNMFFKNLEIVKEGRFIDHASHQKSLFLLYYLATGNTKPQEHELLIAKILCAYPLDEPVEYGIELTETEISEADDLLVNAIQQWEILKNTSSEGLREGFLQRNGKLYTKKENLHLQVETSAIDVLLDQLPYGWNISLVKLPWMENILRIEWR